MMLLPSNVNPINRSGKPLREEIKPEGEPQMWDPSLSGTLTTGKAEEGPAVLSEVQKAQWCWISEGLRQSCRSG